MKAKICGVLFLVAAAIAHQDRFSLNQNCGVYRETVTNLCGTLGQTHPHCAVAVGIAQEAGCMNITNTGRMLLGAAAKSDAQCSPDGNLNCNYGGTSTANCPESLKSLKFWAAWGSGYNRGDCTPFSHNLAMGAITASCENCLGYKWVLTKGYVWHPHKSDRNVGAVGVKRVVCSTDAVCKVYKRAVCIRCPSNQFSSTHPSSISVSTYHTERVNFLNNCAATAMNNYASYKCNDGDKKWFGNDVATL